MQTFARMLVLFMTTPLSTFLERGVFHDVMHFSGYWEKAY